MTQLFRMLSLTVSLCSVVCAADGAQDTENFEVIMVNETVISRTYPNDMYDTDSIKNRCSALQGTLLRATARISKYNGVNAKAGVCRYPKIVKNSERKNINESKTTRYLFQAVASLSFPSGFITPEPILDQCESRGGILIHTKSESTGNAYDTIVNAGVCRIDVDDLSDPLSK